jgi:hypothetical protein
MKTTLRTAGTACAFLLSSFLAFASEGCAASRDITPRVESANAEAWPGVPVVQLTLPATPTLSSEARRLTFLFCAPAGRRTARALALLRESLQHAGYRLELDPKAHHDIRIEVHFEQDGDADAVEVTLDHDGQQIESMVGPLAAGEAGMRATLEELVTRLTLSPRLVLLRGVAT